VLRIPHRENQQEAMMRDEGTEKTSLLDRHPLVCKSKNKRRGFELSPRIAFAEKLTEYLRVAGTHELDPACFHPNVILSPEATYETWRKDKPFGMRYGKHECNICVME
jgi:hypothetical protein